MAPAGTPRAGVGGSVPSGAGFAQGSLQPTLLLCPQVQREDESRGGGPRPALPDR